MNARIHSPVPFILSFVIKYLEKYISFLKLWRPTLKKSLLQIPNLILIVEIYNRFISQLRLWTQNFNYSLICIVTFCFRMKTMIPLVVVVASLLCLIPDSIIAVPNANIFIPIFNNSEIYKLCKIDYKKSFQYVIDLRKCPRCKSYVRFVVRLKS